MLLTHTRIRGDYKEAAFSCNNEHVILWDEGYEDPVVVEKRRVSDDALVRKYPIAAGILIQVVTAPVADCFAVVIEGYTHVFVGAADKPLVVETRLGRRAAFSWDETGSDQLLLAVVCEWGVFLFDMQMKACYMIYHLSPTDCAFSPDGTSLAIIYDAEMAIVQMDMVRQDMQRGVSARLLRPPRGEPTARFVDLLAPGEVDMPRLLPAVRMLDPSFSADSSRLVLRHVDGGGVAVWRMPDAVKIAHTHSGTETAAFMDKKGRFVCMAGNSAPGPRILAWDTQTDTIDRAVFDEDVDLQFSLSRTGDLAYSAESLPALDDDDGTSEGHSYTSTLTAIKYRPATISDEGFDPDIAFEGIKAGGKPPAPPTS